MLNFTRILQILVKLNYYMASKYISIFQLKLSEKSQFDTDYYILPHNPSSQEEGYMYSFWASLCCAVYHWPHFNTSHYILASLTKIISTIQMNMADLFFSYSCDQLFLITLSPCGQGKQTLLAQSDHKQDKWHLPSLFTFWAALKHAF